MHLTIKNYRCFPDSSPITLPLDAESLAFVGTNNAGKSSLIRLLFELRLIISPLFPGRVRPPLSPVSQPVLTEWPHDRNNRPTLVDLFLDDSTAIQIVVAHDGQITASLASANGRTPLIQDNTTTALGESDAFLPLLRDIHEAVFIPALRAASAPGAGELYDIWFGARFVEVWDQYQRGDDKIKNQLIRRVSRDIAHLLSIEHLEIKATQQYDELRLIIDDKSYALREVGSGMAHAIICLATAAIRQPSWVCIDEPETGLHPSLQIDFVNALGSYARRGIWLATHNYGLAKAVSERIFAVRKNGSSSECREWESSSRLSVLLGELSFGGYSAVGGTKVLLVEGPHEVRTFQQFLRMFKKDHKVIIINLGGKQLIRGDKEIELDELRRITNDVHAVIDRDTESKDTPIDSERMKFRANCERLGIRCHILERRATENYFTDRAIKAYDSRFSALREFDEPHDPWWGKSRNWRIAREMTVDEITSTDLGNFLARI